MVRGLNRWVRSAHTWAWLVVSNRGFWPHALMAVACLVGTIGCGREATPTYDVVGKLTYVDSEQTVPGAGVELRPLCPLEDGRRVSIVGVVKEDGSFELSTFKMADGAIAGKHVVMLSEPPPSAGYDWDLEGQPRAYIPKKYKTFSTSGITFEVTPHGENRLQIEIEKPMG